MSRSEEAFVALRDALDRVMRQDGFATVRRNETLDTVIESLGEKGGNHVNVLDGDAEAPEEALGADGPEVPEGYELALRPEIEFYVMHDRAEVRDALFDAGLTKIHDGIAAAIAGFPARTLGGVVSHVRIAGIDRSHPRTNGLPGIKGCIVRLTVDLTSSRPF